jgi:hypothetical protein
VHEKIVRQQKKDICTRKLEQLAILRATDLFKLGSRVPAFKMSKRVQWHDGVRLELFETMLDRVTNCNQEQPIDFDPNTILHNSLITTTYFHPLI